jgi:hypothetical protein
VSEREVATGRRGLVATTNDHLFYLAEVCPHLFSSMHVRLRLSYIWREARAMAAVVSASVEAVRPKEKFTHLIEVKEIIGFRVSVLWLRV